MSVCRHYKQMIAAFCVFSLSGVSQASAPLCSSTLLETQRAVLDADLAQVIEGLALLKMNIDLAKANGGGSITRLTSAYPMKFQELAKAVRDKLNEAQLRDLITKKIRKLQEQKESKTSSTNEERDSQSKNLKEITTLTRQFRLPFRAYSHIFEYIPESNSLLIKNDREALIIFNLQNKNIRYLQQVSRVAHVSPKGEVIAIDSEGVFLRFNLKTNKQMASAKTGLELFPVSSLSKSGKKLAVLSEEKKEIYIIDVKTGKHELLQLPPELGERYSSIAFLGDKELLISASGKAVLFRFNIETGAFDTYQLPGYVLERMEISRDGSTMIWSRSETSGFIKISELDQFEQKTVEMHQTVMKLFGDDKVYIMSKENESRGIYLMSDLTKPVLSFPYESSDYIAFPSPAFDIRNNRFFLRSHLRRSDQMSLELWEMRSPNDVSPVLVE